jgi:hypothetical protein
MIIKSTVASRCWVHIPRNKVRPLHAPAPAALRRVSERIVRLDSPGQPGLERLRVAAKRHAAKTSRAMAPTGPSATPSPGTGNGGFSPLGYIPHSCYLPHPFWCLCSFPKVLKFAAFRSE